jgi:uncharacterized protein YqhQ
MTRHALTVSFAVLALLTAVVFFYLSLGLPPAAYQLPRILIVLIVLLSLGMLGESHLRSKKEKETAAEGSAEEAFSGSSIRTPAIYALLIAGYVFLLQPIGYFIMTPVFIIASFFFLKSARPVAAAVTAFCFTIFVYLLFVLFLHLPIPMGILSGIL